MKTLAIVGAGGHGRVVADLAVACGWAPAFFDDVPMADSNTSAWPYHGTTSELLARATSFDGLVVAIGNNTTRLTLGQRLLAAGGKLVSIVHPSAVVSGSARLASGSVVMPNAVIMADAALGQASIVNTAASVDHDCRVGDGVHISPGARLCGGVTVGDLVWIGAGAILIPGMTVGASAIIGAGSVVIRPVEAHTTVVGNPAKQLARN